MQDSWTVWRDSLLFQSSEQAQALSSAESSLETSPECVTLLFLFGHGVTDHLTGTEMGLPLMVRCV